MAQRVQVILEDDIDGTDAVETVQFALDGTTYEVDLNEQHATQLREGFTTWIGAARKVRGTASKRSSASGVSRPKADPELLNKIREWGRANGHHVSDRGRVSQQVQDAYRQAH
ncbi:Lsr2 family protein [Allobranchiibius sp. CTAmp26]|uniref:histone-like nucleoid-structuring protein Lsr2 n=1 Tax=Allobranchiibius sp. CTAmp26 TaxID=2815214 RepID=UPI001AA17B65|nr:Lsr2 family protein [Allobranchiibius sp. CTAmp26]MBO1756511.1 Lsr2 family protein [Allobranchiibius sp. CTAmp26]